MNGTNDQAEGLRRLLIGSHARVIGVVGMSPGVGATTVVMNLAVEVARRGKPALIVDEHAASRRSVCANWALVPSRSAAEVASRRVPLIRAASVSGSGVRVLDARPGSACVNPHALMPAGVILVDACLDGEGELSAMARLCDELVVVMQPTPGSITAAYAGLKRLQHAHALQEFKFLVNAVDDEGQASLAIGNIVETCRRYLAVRLTSIGWIAADNLVRDAERVHRTVCEAHPGSPAAARFRSAAEAIARSASAPHRRSSVRPGHAGAVAQRAGA